MSDTEAIAEEIALRKQVVQLRRSLNKVCLHSWDVGSCAYCVMCGIDRRIAEAVRCAVPPVDPGRGDR